MIIRAQISDFRTINHLCGYFWFLVALYIKIKKTHSHRKGAQFNKSINSVNRLWLSSLRPFSTIFHKVGVCMYWLLFVVVLFILNNYRSIWFPKYKRTYSMHSKLMDLVTLIVFALKKNQYFLTFHFSIFFSQRITLIYY